MTEGKSPYIFFDEVSLTVLPRLVSLMGIIVLLIQILSFPAIAQKVEYNDGYNLIYYEDGSKEIINGALNFLRYDGVWRPTDELNISNGSWPYLYSENASNASFEVNDTTLNIPKANTKFKTRFNSISYDLIYSKSELQGKEQYINLTDAFIDFPYTLKSRKQKNEYKEDEFNIKYDRFHFRAGLEHIVIHDDTPRDYVEDGKVFQDVTYLNKKDYDFMIKNGQIRLVFKKDAINKLNGNIIIEIRTWDIVGANNSLWGGNVTFNSTSEVRATGNVELRQKVDDYVLYTRFDEGNGRIIHNENTSNVNVRVGNLEGYLGTNSTSGKYVTGKFGQAFFFNGINNKVLFNDDPSIRLPYNFSISFYLKQQPGVNNSDTDILRKGSTATATSGEWYKVELTDNITHGDIQKNNSTYHTYDSMQRRDGIWHFYTYARKSTTCSLKVDGITINSTACVKNTSNTALFSIGSKDTYNQTTGLDFTNGTIDEVRVYNRGLNESDLSYIRNNTHYMSGTITRNLTSVIGTGEGILESGCNGTWDRSITKVDVLASTNNVNWVTIQSNAYPDVVYSINPWNNYRYSRCALSTTNASNTPIIESIRTRIGPKVAVVTGKVTDSALSGIAGAIVSINTGQSNTTNSTGFYSLSVPEGTYNITGRFDPMYYSNTTTFSVTSANVTKNITLLKKPTGNIAGSVNCSVC